MRFSVVISTYNRAESLRQTLSSLRLQQHPDFEVLVVNGPSTDGTDAVLREFPDVRSLTCDVANLSRSRNLGIAASAGQVVAFVDDDGVPDPRWLTDLEEAFADPQVGGAGGIVFDRSGLSLQYRYAACSRSGLTRFDVEPPFDAMARRGADPFVYLQGTNMSFRRDVLAAVGGFDEALEHYHDDTEICLQVIDAGCRVLPLPRAAVHHKYRANHTRNEDRVVLDPFSVVNNRYCFALRNSPRGPEVLRVLDRWVAEVRASAETHHYNGRMTSQQFEHFMRRVSDAVQTGTEKGLQTARQRQSFAAAEPGAFVRYATRVPEGRRLHVCFLSCEYPPGDFGGVGRYTHDLATHFAAAGHEVHVITNAAAGQPPEVTLDDDVWVHRLTNADRGVADLQNAPLRDNLYLLARNYHELCRIDDHARLDVVCAPLWLCEGLMASLDGRFRCVTTIMTAMKTIASMHSSWETNPHTRQLVRLEELTARSADRIHAISHDILRKFRSDYAVAPPEAFVVPLGVRDRSAQVRSTRRAGDREVRVLFVGRLERRKGVDLLLESAAKLCREHASLRFIFAGKDTPNTEMDGVTYRDAFARRHAADADLLRRVEFTGPVSEETLHQLYADCDIFVLPSRYESFGLVLLEAMLFAKPVVAAAIGGMQEIVEHDGNGLLVPVEDAEALAGAIGRLAGDADLRRRFGARSRAIYEQRFSAAVMTRNTVEAFARVADQPRATRARREAADALGAIIADAAMMDAGVAARAAGALFHEADPVVDYAAAVRSLLGASPQDFVRGLFSLLLGRDVDRNGMQFYLEAMGQGATRHDVVRTIALSDEALKRGLPRDWLDRIEPARPAAAPTAPADAGTPLGYASWRWRLRQLPLLGAALRYLRRLVMMPWNLQEQLDMMRSQSQRHGAQLTATLDAAIRARQRLDELAAAAQRIDGIAQSTHAVRDVAEQQQLAIMLLIRQIAEQRQQVDEILGQMHRSSMAAQSQREHGMQALQLSQARLEHAVAALGRIERDLAGGNGTVAHDAAPTGGRVSVEIGPGARTAGGSAARQS